MLGSTIYKKMARICYKYIKKWFLNNGYKSHESMLNTMSSASTPITTVLEVESGLLIDCCKTIEYFLFRFWSQNHSLFFFQYFFQKNLKYFAYTIVCDKGVSLGDWTA